MLLSDVGVLSREAQSELPHARLLAIEANYDAGLLDEAVQANSQVRFAVDVRGNFSNAQAASTVEAYAWPGLKDVVALYLSRQYNAPTRATAAIETALEQAGCEARVACASPDETLSVLPEGESAGDGNETAVEEPASEQLAPESPASEEPASEQSAHESPMPAALAPYSAPEDILLPEQAREMGYTDLQGLLALWVQQGCLAESPVISADGLLRALIAADMLDPRDMTPTEKGIELGVWAAFETEGLAPIFAACMAGGLWEHVQAFL